MSPVRNSDAGVQPDLPVVRDAACAPASPTRQRVSKEASEMTAEDLLTLLLGPAQGPACAKLARGYRSFREVASAHPLDWRDAGLTGAGVERLSAIFEIARRYGEVEWVPGEPFKGSYDVYAHFRERLAAETREEFYGIVLDNRHRKIRDVLLSVGSLTASIVHPRDVYGRIIRDAAAAVIFLHNHPSGDPTPSAEDLEITRRLREVGELVGVKVLDHIVIGKGRYVSFVDDGYW